MEEDGGQWWVRRAVLSVLAVLGVVTAVFAVGAVRSGPAPTEEVEVGNEAVTTFATPTPSVSDGPLRLGEVLVAGRHGAPVERPAHTLESYELAVEAGADYLEVQVVMTSDGQLVVRGDHELSGSTDVAGRAEFADRETTKTVDGLTRTGWFTEDFTLEELLTLRAVEPDPDLRPQNTTYDGDLPLVSFDDLLVRVRELSQELGREVGLFVEPVRAAYFREVGLPMEPAVAKALRKARLAIESELVTIESGDLAVLERLADNLGDNVLSAYRIGAESVGELEAEALAGLPDVIDAVVVETSAFADQCPYDLVDRVHEAGLALAVYPISYENARLADGFRRGEDPAGRGNLDAQVLGLALIGTDVVFAEAPAEVVEALAAVPEDAARAAVPECEPSG